MENKVFARKAREGEIPWIESVHKSLLSGEDSLGEFPGQSEWWVLTNQYGKKVGFAGGSLDHTLGSKCESVLHLTAAWVDGEYRGLGGQKKLIRARVQFAKKYGCSTVLTYTHYRNYPSINSLITCGFKSYIPEWAIYDAPWISWKLKV